MNEIINKPPDSVNLHEQLVEARCSRRHVTELMLRRHVPAASLDRNQSTEHKHAGAGRIEFRVHPRTAAADPLQFRDKVPAHTGVLLLGTALSSA